MKLNKVTSTMAALAVGAIMGASAHAQSSGNPGDLILGFEEPGAGGSGNVYEVDLGAVSQFLGASTPLNFSLSSSDLSSNFGSSWASSSLLQFGVIGGTQSTGGNLTVGSYTLAQNTLFTTWNTFAAAPTEKASSVQATAQADINQLYNDVANVAAPSAGSTNALPAVNTDTSDADGIAYLNTHKANFNFGSGYATSDLDFNSDGTTSAPDSATLDLYELTPTNASTGAQPTDLLGQFTLSSSGVLTFTPESVPEPSAYALGLAAAALFFVLKRRQSIGRV